MSIQVAKSPLTRRHRLRYQREHGLTQAGGSYNWSTGQSSSLTRSVPPLPQLRSPVSPSAMAPSSPTPASLGGPTDSASTVSPPEFYQHRKSWETVTVEFDGSRSVGVPGDIAGELEKEIGLGSVSLEVAVDARVRYKLYKIKIRQKPKVWCSLTIPVKPDQGGGGVSGALASGDRCSVKY